MSDTSQGPGWWLASDGKWYAPASATTPSPPPPMPPRTAVYPPFAGAPGPGWWLARDGNWYPPPSPQTAPMSWAQPFVTPKTNGLAIWSFVLALVLGTIGALAAIPMGYAARRQVRKSNGAQKGAGLALAAIIIGYVWIGLLVLVVTLAVVTPNSDNTSTSGIAFGPSLSALTSDVQAYIVGSGPGHFDVSGVASVVCDPPGSWQAGATFTCFAYSSSQSEIGQLDGTVEPNSSSGEYRWNARWIPNN
jgi:Domain of unknown function (DUF4190)